MFQDKVISGSISGILAKIFADIIEFPLWKLGVIKHPLSHYAQSIFIKPVHQIFYGSWIGFLADYIYSVFLGIIFFYFLQLSGKRYHLIKGILYGAFLWLMSYGWIRSLPVVKFRTVISQDVIPQFFLHLVYGLALGWMVYWLERLGKSKKF